MKFLKYKMNLSREHLFSLLYCSPIRWFNGITNQNITLVFCSSSRRNIGRIAGYVTEVTTPKTDKKTSNNDKLVIANCLRNAHGITWATDAGFLFVFKAYK